MNLEQEVVLLKEVMAVSLYKGIEQKYSKPIRKDKPAIEIDDIDDITLLKTHWIAGYRNKPFINLYFGYTITGKLQINYTDYPGSVLTTKTRIPEVIVNEFRCRGSNYMFQDITAYDKLVVYQSGYTLEDVITCIMKYIEEFILKPTQYLYLEVIKINMARILTPAELFEMY